ncbi:hypothetical protein [Thioalkalivibrio sp. ALJ16]|uniref:hypothetical protein n=1 Tax=Thioalkalivibrio sp. ALJ16 TaxID=1158762 RepID=UPI0003820935|nr:hypothetical protein [Thioalkalivibrio sp. ALJ16]
MDQDEFEQRLREDSSRMFSSEDAGRRYFIRKPPTFPKIESFSEFQKAHDAIVAAASERLNEIVGAGLSTRDVALASQIEGINMNLSLRALEAAGDPRWTVLDSRVESLRQGVAIAMEIWKQKRGGDA